jgi:hypothetical protein
MTLTSSGNLGLGVTPSAWTSAHKVFQFGAVGSIETDNDAVAVSNNRYFDGINRYSANDFASIYVQVNGEHRWLTAPSGIAGNAITFTTPMMLASTGNLLIGTTTDAGYKLDVNGTGRFSGALGISFASGTGSTINLTNTSSASNSNVIETQYNIYDGAVGLSLVASSGVLNPNIGNVNGAFYWKTKFNGSALTTRLYIEQSGNVGIGTSSPANLLQIATSSQQDDTYGYAQTYYNGTNPNYNSGYTYKNYNGTSQFMQWSYFGVRLGSRIVTNSGQGEVVFTYGADAEGMRISSGGVLRITNASQTLGTLVGSERLNINGDVFAYGSLYVNTNIISYGTITTGPTGYGAGAFKIGPLQTGTASSAAGCIPIVIDGTLRYINVFNAI